MIGQHYPAGNGPWLPTGRSAAAKMNAQPLRPPTVPWQLSPWTPELLLPSQPADCSCPIHTINAVQHYWTTPKCECEAGLWITAGTLAQLPWKDKRLGRGRGWSGTVIWQRTWPHSNFLNCGRGDWWDNDQFKLVFTEQASAEAVCTCKMLPTLF